MGKTYRFLSSPPDSGVVCEWFRNLDPAPVEQVTEKGIIFYFKHLGTLSDVPSNSPVVNVIRPQVRRGILTTAGEVHFLATPLKQFPELDRVNQVFRRWISQHPKVHSMTSVLDDSFDYYIEGSLRNWDSDIFALPSGIMALESGSYFVSDDDSEGLLDDLCKRLRLRGVTGITVAEHASGLNGLQP